jgi:hypothetical protein
MEPLPRPRTDGAAGAALAGADAGQDLRHVLASHQKYYNEVRTHLSLQKDEPVRRDVCRTGRVRSSPILGGYTINMFEFEFPTGTTTDEKERISLFAPSSNAIPYHIAIAKPVGSGRKRKDATVAGGLANHAAPRRFGGIVVPTIEYSRLRSKGQIEVHLSEWTLK